ncbi:hypothetical protein Btru_037302 [Bulinus truncatus]|nr:hypothetical protein Btru_037302 [Bulinus truncatus]
MRSSSNGGEVKRFNGGELVSNSTLRSEARLRPEMKTVKITPMKAPAEINNALRRQRRVAGIRYTTSTSTTAAAAATPSLFRPTYWAVLPEAFQPNYTQCTITTSHSMTGEPAGGPGVGESSFVVTRVTDEQGRKNAAAVHHERTVIRNMGVASIRDSDGPRAVNATKAAISINKVAPSIANSAKSASPRSNDNILDGPVKSHLAYAQNGFQGQGYNNGEWMHREGVLLPGSSSSSTLPPGFRFMNTFAPDNNPFGFSRALTSDRLTRRYPGGPSVRKLSYNDDMMLPGQRIFREDPLSLGQGRRGQIDLNPSPPPPWLHDSLGSPRGGIIRMMAPYLQSNSTSSSNPGKDAIIHKREPAAITEAPPSQNTLKLADFSSLDLADSIIRAVKEDMNEVYNLCQTRVKYSDFIEKAQPHRLLRDRGALNEILENRREGESISSEPSTKSVISPKSTVTPPNRTGLFSNLRSKHVASSSAIPPLDLDLTRSTPPEPHRDVEMVSISTPPEPEIDYDKPITIIIESDHDGPLKSTRPILKQTSKLNSVTGNSEKTKNGDSNNNRLTHLSTALATHAESVEWTTDVISLQGKTYSQHEQVTPANRDKGRLVRFNVDPKIHEFTPSEPVLSPR